MQRCERQNTRTTKKERKRGDRRSFYVLCVTITLKCVAQQTSEEL